RGRVGPRGVAARRAAGRLGDHRPPVAGRRLPAPHRAQLRPHRGEGMTTLTHSWFMTLRHLRNLARQPWWIAITLVQPVIWLLLFRAVFKATADIPGVVGDSYIDYLTAGLVVMTGAFAGGWAGMGVIEDLNRGVVDRFLVSPVARQALISG